MSRTANRFRPCGDDALWQRVCRRAAADVCEQAALLCERYRVDRRDLLRQLLLHAPRFPYPQRRSTVFVLSEARRLLGELLTDREKARRAGILLACDDAPLSEFSLTEVPEDWTRCVLQYLHYLRSPRDVVACLALKSPRQENPAGVMTLSRFDLGHIQEILDGTEDETLVLSRVYAFPGAPKNHVSFALAGILRLIPSKFPHVRRIVTYINPNLGFDGSSMKASNWVPLCTESRDYYLYEDGRYVTDREALARFGSSKFHDLNMMLGHRIARSYARLKPMLVFARGITPADHDRVRNVGARRLLTHPARVSRARAHH